VGGIALTSAVSRAQNPVVSINNLALEWARGRWASPLICEFDDRPVRGVRRILIAEGPENVRPEVDRILFVAMDSAEATRCSNDFGEPQPDISGTLQIRLPGHHSPSDLAMKGFHTALKRNRGFEFTIVAGKLRLRAVGAASNDSRVVDFAGGTATLGLAARGSDTERVLRDFVSARKATLQIEARDGPRLRFPVYFAAER